MYKPVHLGHTLNRRFTQNRRSYFGGAVPVLPDMQEISVCIFRDGSSSPEAVIPFLIPINAGREYYYAINRQL